VRHFVKQDTERTQRTSSVQLFPLHLPRVRFWCTCTCYHLFNTIIQQLTYGLKLAVVLA